VNDQLTLFKEKKLLLVLYSGTQSIEKQFNLDEWDIISVEVNDIFTREPYNLKQWTISVGDLTAKKVLKKTGGRVPDMIWASPVCTTDSIAAISTHRTYVDGFGKTKKARNETHTLIAKSDKAKLFDELLLVTILLIRDLKPKLYFIENPRGGMRYKPIMIGVMFRYTITYCSYGDTSMKPTDIWTNHPNPDFKKMCFNGNKDCHHASAPRGSKTEGSTQGKKGNTVRSMIPEGFCEHIAKITNEYINGGSQ
jgi:hypothetical protein